MFPIGDDNTARRIVPVVTYVLIAINVVVFLLAAEQHPFIREWAFVPARFSQSPQPS